MSKLSVKIMLGLTFIFVLDVVVQILSYTQMFYLSSGQWRALQLGYVVIFSTLFLIYLFVINRKIVPINEFLQRRQNNMDLSERVVDKAYTAVSDIALFATKGWMLVILGVMIIGSMFFAMFVNCGAYVYYGYIAANFGGLMGFSVMVYAITRLLTTPAMREITGHSLKYNLEFKKGLSLRTKVLCALGFFCVTCGMYSGFFSYTNIVKTMIDDMQKNGNSVVHILSQELQGKLRDGTGSYPSQLSAIAQNVKFDNQSIDFVSDREGNMTVSYTHLTLPTN